MCEKDFNSLVNAEFLADYERRFAEIGQAEQNAVDACAELDAQCEREIAEIDKQHQEFKLAAEQTLASIEERSNAQFAGAENRYAADEAEYEKKIRSAQRTFNKGTKECENKRTKLHQDDNKTKADIEKKYKADLFNEDKRFKEVIKKREKDFKTQADNYTRRLDDLRDSYEKNVDEIKRKISELHRYFKNNDESSLADLNKVKDRCNGQIKEKQDEYTELQNSLNEQMKSTTEKQKLKTLRNQASSAKSACDASVAILKGEIATAQKVYDLKRSESFAQLTVELTNLQKQLRTFKAELDFDKASVSYEQRFAEAKNQNRILAEERQNAENITQIELWRQDELNKQYSEVFCGDYDVDVGLKQVKCDFDVASEEESKNLNLKKFEFEVSKKIIEVTKSIDDHEQEMLSEQEAARVERATKRQKEQCRHDKQIHSIDIYSLGLKTANDSEKLLNDLKLRRNTDAITRRIESVRQRLQEDLAFMQSMRDYQQAEYEAILRTNESYYDRQRNAVQQLLDESTAQERKTETEIFAKTLSNIETAKQKADADLKAQADFISEMLNTEENRINEQAQKELAALELFIKEYSDLTEKYNGLSDELAIKSDENKKDTVVDLLGAFENQMAKYDSEYEDVIKESKADHAEYEKTYIVEKETFIQESDDLAARERKDCRLEQDDLRAKMQAFYNEAEKNKSISKGVLGEQLCKSFDAMQDKQNENVQLLAQKNNELKSFENACNKAVADARKDCEKKLNEYEKLRIKEERWLLRNGDVDYDKEWWVVDFNARP